MIDVDCQERIIHMKERFEKLADDMMTAAQLTGYKVSVSRDSCDVSVVFVFNTGKTILTELFGASTIGDPYRFVNADNEHFYLDTEEEFVAMLTERFRGYGVDFNKIRERITA